MPIDPTDMRHSYELGDFSEADLAPDWLTQFTHWFEIARATPEIVEPNAMTFATAGANGRPSARTVLLKGVDERGFVLYTNYESRKARETAANPFGALVFPWLPLQRQVVVTGAIERVSAEQSDAYFATRPHGSQLGAAASPQSRVIQDRSVLDAARAELAARYPDAVPRPAHWGGLRVVPDSVEFWQGRLNRLHDRLRYRRTPDSAWVVERLAP